MKVCVYGAGAIGGHVAARLISAGDAQVSIIARGAQLQAIREKGVTLISGGARFGGMAAQATDDPSELPPQDLVGQSPGFWLPTAQSPSSTMAYHGGGTMV